MLMLAHGLTTGALFMLVGVIYDRTHTRIISELGGLSITMPRFAFNMFVCAFGSLGLPGLVGFWGEFLIVKGTFTGNPVWSSLYAWNLPGNILLRIFAVCAVIGIILTAGYILWMLERVMLGREFPRWKGLPDMIAHEYWALVPITLLVVVFGVYPRPLMALFEYFSTTLAQSLGKLA